ncbi:PREDICTED: uncharacterized protein LOC107327018 [Acropora digitifera]|uniref:uncharacterized protein LOC107327018 n=1 Tax=Acropora digitifera TaxID=70779 RepID=UPI00077A0B0E|nr:PREDICTED: uncharacterized protein LOC107327018 [Acropora digitifera]
MTNPPELKSNTPLEKEPSVLTESNEKCSSWFEKAYTSFSTAAESLLKWLYIGIEWPVNINQGMFTLRTVTRSDKCPVNDFANRSLVSLEMEFASKEVEISSRFVQKSPDKNVLPANHTGNEANCISPDLIANGNQTGNEAKWMPPDLITSGEQIRNKSEDEKAGNQSIKGHQSMVVFLGQFKEWPALWIGENRIGNGDHMPVNPANPVLKESLESSGRTILNYSYTQEEAMCPKDLLDAGYWIQNDGFDCNENLTLGAEDPLKDRTIVKDVVVKVGKEETTVNKSVMCPVRSNKGDPHGLIHYIRDRPNCSWDEGCQNDFVHQVQVSVINSRQL